MAGFDGSVSKDLHVQACLWLVDNGGESWVAEVESQAFSQAFKQGVVGSSPTGPTKQIRRFDPR